MKRTPLKILYLFISVSITTNFLFNELIAQNEVDLLKDKGYRALHQAITDLKSDFTLMSVAAHPDDEDLETLTYYRRKEGVKTVVVVATRGEGGQNEIRPELYRDLGVIRTYEMWRAGTISGTEYYNLNLEDFGYSKTAEETFEKWGHEAPLSQLVHLIRKLRPDVIITNHDTNTGHGNHQALGILIREAFVLAGDPNKFPEQFENGLSVWKPKRLFQRLWHSEGAEVTVPVGDFDPVWGESYAQMAARALSEHRSQGMELFAKRIKRGPRFTYYKIINSIDGQVLKGSDLFAGLPDSFEEIKANYSLDKINQLKNVRLQTISKFFSNSSELRRALVNELALWHKLENDLGKMSQFSHTVKKQINKLEKAIFHALSLDFSVHLSDKKVIRGQNAQFKAVLFNGGNEDVILKSITLIPRNQWFGMKDIKLSNKLSYNQSDTALFNFGIPDTAKYTIPKTVVFYQTEHWEPLLKALVEYEYRGVLLHAWTETDFDIVPKLELNLEPSKTVIPLSFIGYNRYFVVQITNNIPDSVSGEISLKWVDSSSLNDSILITKSFSLKNENEATTIMFEVQIPTNFQIGDYQLKVNANCSNSRGNEIHLQTKGLVRVIDVKTISDLKVGLIKSYDNTLQDALNQLGIENKLLTSEILQWGDLSRFDTIILDIRAYLVREDLRKNNARILDYVKKGGNLIVMYQKVFEWNPEYGNPQWAPFSLILSRQRVTYEDAPIEMLAPEHPLFNYPNKITTADWDGWVQERGLYFPSKWAADFKPLLSMSDPREPALIGSYLAANFGKGTYIFTSLVWYRQLRALVPGAYRNLANMVGYAKAKLNQ
ncbi:MAG: PIG-L family deacetylase [bacterium]